MSFSSYDGYHYLKKKKSSFQTHIISFLAFIILHITTTEASPNEYSWLGRLLRGGNDPQETKPPKPSQNIMDEYPYQKMIPRTSYIQSNYNPNNSLDSIYYHQQPASIEYTNRNIDGVDVGNEQRMIHQQKQNRRENIEQEEKNRSSMSYTHSPSGEYWSGRDPLHYHKDMGQQHLQNHQEYTDLRMMPSSHEHMAINKRSFSVQCQGCQKPMHDENFNASDTCFFPNHNVWDEPSYNPPKKQGYRYIPMSNHGQYDLEKMESYNPRHYSLVSGGEIDDGINRTWDRQQVPFESYVNGLESPSSINPLYQPQHQQNQDNECVELSVENKRGTKQAPNSREKKENAKNNNSGIGSWWGSSNKQTSQRTSQELFKKEQLNMDMKGPNYELYTNQVKNSKDLHRQKIIEIQEQQELHYREWQKNQRHLFNENNNMYSICKTKPQSMMIDKDERIIFLHNKLESILAKQNESYNKVEKKIQDQTRNYVLKFNQMAERLTNLETYSTAQSNLVKEYRANYTSLNNSLIEMKETIRDYESKLEGSNVNTDLKALHDAGDQEKNHEFNDNKNEFDVMINTLHNKL